MSDGECITCVAWRQCTGNPEAVCRWCREGAGPWVDGPPPPPLQPRRKIVRRNTKTPTSTPWRAQNTGDAQRAAAKKAPTPSKARKAPKPQGPHRACSRCKRPGHNARTCTARAGSRG